MACIVREVLKEIEEIEKEKQKAEKIFRRVEGRHLMEKIYRKMENSLFERVERYGFESLRLKGKEAIFHIKNRRKLTVNKLPCIMSRIQELISKGYQVKIYVRGELLEIRVYKPRFVRWVKKKVISASEKYLCFDISILESQHLSNFVDHLATEVYGAKLPATKFFKKQGDL